MSLDEFASFSFEKDLMLDRRHAVVLINPRARRSWPDTEQARRLAYELLWEWGAVRGLAARRKMRIAKWDFGRWAGYAMEYDCINSRVRGIPFRCLSASVGSRLTGYGVGPGDMLRGHEELLVVDELPDVAADAAGGYQTPTGIDGLEEWVIGG